MIRRPPRSTRTDTLFPYTTLFRTNYFYSTKSLQLVRPRLQFGLCARLSLDRATSLIRRTPNWTVLWRARLNLIAGAIAPVHRTSLRERGGIMLRLFGALTREAIRVTFGDLEETVPANTV